METGQRAIVAFSPLIALVGCGRASPPTLSFAGAYFPAWMLCLGISVVVALLARTVMLATGLSERLPFQLFLCSAIGAIAAFSIARVWFD